MAVGGQNERSNGSRILAVSRRCRSGYRYRWHLFVHEAVSAESARHTGQRRMPRAIAALRYAQASSAGLDAGLW
jgi:hypothetical protein